MIDDAPDLAELRRELAEMVGKRGNGALFLRKARFLAELLNRDVGTVMDQALEDHKEAKR